MWMNAQGMIKYFKVMCDVENETTFISQENSIKDESENVWYVKRTFDLHNDNFEISCVKKYKTNC